MKRKLVGIMCFIFLLTLAVSGWCMAATGFTVYQNSAKVIVNGKVTNFEAYTIDGFNYFKLRDIAMVVNGTGKQFEVTYDSAKRAINLVSNAAYTIAGGELAPGDGSAKQAFFNSAIIYKDGKIASLSAFTIAGYNFFKLRDLTKTFNIEVNWDQASSTIGIETSRPYVDAVQTAVWYAPNYQNDLARIISSFSEGYFVGLRSASLLEWEKQLVTIYDASMKPVAYTNYRAEDGMFGAVHNGLINVTSMTKTVTVDGEAYAVAGYIDTAGNLIIPEKYFQTTSFKNGVAIVHEMRGTTAYTLLINTKDEILMQKKGVYLGEIGGNAVYFQDSYIDANGNPYTGEIEGYYDFSGNYSRYPISDDSGYWGEDGYWVERHGYHPSEASAFNVQYAGLYEHTEYLGNGFIKVWESNPYSYPGVVDLKNRVIIPINAYQTIDAVATETSMFFIVSGDADPIYDALSVISPSGQKILSRVHQVSFAGGEAIYYFQHDAYGNGTWGLIETNGHELVANSYNFLMYFDPYTGGLTSYYESTNPGAASILLYTSGTMDERADTSKMSENLLVAQDYYQQLTEQNLAAENSYYYNELNRYIQRANALLNMEKPAWIDVSLTETWLGLICGSVAPILYGFPSGE